MGRLSLLAGSLNAHFPFFTPGGNGDNLTQHSVATLYKQAECCDQAPDLAVIL